MIIAWAPILAPWPDSVLRAVEPLIPERQLETAMRFHRWQDRQARVLARLALRQILRVRHIDKSLGDMAVTPQGRPFIPGAGDFSLAHTATLAVCAWVPRGRVGIDVETSRPELSIEDLSPWMSSTERRGIAASAAPMKEVLRLWTAKEAVCKAEGCGIAAGGLPDCSAPLVAFRGKLWRVRSRSRRGHTLSIAQTADQPWVLHTIRLRIDGRPDGR